MRCRKAQEWISLWIDGRLNAQQERSLLEHLEQCEHCQMVASHWKSLREVLKAYPPITPSAELEARIWQTVRERKRRPSWWGKPLFQLSASAAAGVVITLCLLTAMWLNTPRETESSRQTFLLGGRDAQTLTTELLIGEGGDLRWHDGSSSRSLLPFCLWWQS